VVFSPAKLCQNTLARVFCSCFPIMDKEYHELWSIQKVIRGTEISSDVNFAKYCLSNQPFERVGMGGPLQGRPLCLHYPRLQRMWPEYGFAQKARFFWGTSSGRDTYLARKASGHVELRDRLGGHAGNQPLCPEFAFLIPGEG